MQHVRPPTSLRPQIFVDPRTRGLVDSGRDHIGREAPFGRERVLFALPLDPGPSLLDPPRLLFAPGGSDVIGDPDGAVIGVAAVWVSRMHTARWTEDTRRIAG